MISSTGVDLVEIARIKKAIEKNRKFIHRIMTTTERQQCEEKGNRAETIAGIFSAKEAVAKVLETGIGKVSWKEIQILKSSEGAPKVVLAGKAKEVAILKSIKQIHVSITHSSDSAMAFAIGEINENKEEKKMQSEQLKRPVWAEVYLDHLSHNIQEIRKNIPTETTICAVIKANGYGHGSVNMASHLERCGIDRFAVATLTEALELRHNGCEKPILILGYTPDELVQEAVEKELQLTTYTMDQAQIISQKAVDRKKEALIHIKLDTGMSRLGFQPTIQSLEEIKNITGLPNLVVEGIYTHFAAADDENKDETRRQINKFNEFCREMENRDIQIPMKHMANSAAIIDMPETHLDMVRAGIMMYGLYPSNEVNHGTFKLKRVMSLKTRIAHVKEIEEGTGVSYGLTFRASKKMKIATLPIGYADGYSRLLGEKAEVMVRGHKCPVVGRICMDQCMVDVTGLSVHRGEEVTLYATEDEYGDTVDDVARKLDTINYEITCMVSRRVPRLYIENGLVIQHRDDLL